MKKCRIVFDIVNHLGALNVYTMSEKWLNLDDFIESCYKSYYNNNSMLRHVNEIEILGENGGCF